MQVWTVKCLPQVGLLAHPSSHAITFFVVVVMARTEICSLSHFWRYDGVLLTAVTRLYARLPELTLQPEVCTV